MAAILSQPECVRFSSFATAANVGHWVWWFCCFEHHDDVTEWKFVPCIWPFHRSPENSPHKGQWRRPLIFSLICVWTNGWVHNRDAGDLIYRRAHYDVTIIPNAIIPIVSNLYNFESQRTSFVDQNPHFSFKSGTFEFSRMGILYEHFLG